MRTFETKSTKTFKAVDANLTITECAEPTCQVTMLVEKDEIAMGRKHRCIACVTKSKFSKLMG